MENKRKKRFARAAFMLGGLLLLMNGIVLIGESKVVFGIIQVIASFLNFGMLRNFKNLKAKRNLEYGVFIMNIIISLLIARDYIQAGSSYIHYVWIFSAILYTVALVFIIRKKSGVNDQ